MAGWEDAEVEGSDEPGAGRPPVARDYAQIWRAADKVVYSRTLGDRLHARTRALPDGVRLGLELLDEHRFGNGVVHLHYRVG